MNQYRMLFLLTLVYFTSVNVLAMEVRVSDSQLSARKYRGDESITKIVVPGNIRKIPSFSFADCVNLSEVVFEGESMLNEIGEYAFWNCSSLKYISLPTTVRMMGNGVFYECVSLEELTLPPYMLKIPAYMCGWCESLRKVEMSHRLQKIGSHAFTYCFKLKGVSFPASLLEIESNAFSCCKSLDGVSLPSGLRLLESYSFSDCESLKIAVLPTNGNELGELIFSGCDRLETIIEMSPVVPKFECNSFLAEPIDEAFYERVRLIVSPGMKAKYSASHAWRLFKVIEEGNK